MIVPFVGSFSAICCGASGSGKSFFIVKLLKHLAAMTDKPIHEVLWCFGISQPLHKEIGKICPVPVRFHEGVPDFESEFKTSGGNKRCLVIIDDLYRELNDSVVDLFTRTAHHRNLCVVLVTQNIFGKGLRDISLNAQYVIAFAAPRDRAQMRYFCRQVDPSNAKVLEEAYRDATSTPHSYLLFDLTQGAEEHIRYRTNIFPGEQTIVYIPKNLKL
jgi:hypothetical protein